MQNVYVMCNLQGVYWTWRILIRNTYDDLWWHDKIAPKVFFLFSTKLHINKMFLYTFFYLARFSNILCLLKAKIFLLYNKKFCRHPKFHCIRHISIYVILLIKNCIVLFIDVTVSVCLHLFFLLSYILTICLISIWIDFCTKLFVYNMYETHKLSL